MIHQKANCEDTIGGRISLGRENAGLSIEGAARRLGVLPESWIAWECDRDVPRSNRVAMMAGVLGVSPAWLLCGQGSGPVEAGKPKLLDAIRQVTDEVSALNKRLDQLTRTLEQQAQTEGLSA